VHSLLPDDLLLPILLHLDVKSLIEKKQVCRTWRHNCTGAIDAKQTLAFLTNEELCLAVTLYYEYTCDPQYAKELAQMCGYPIDKWDVSTFKTFRLSFSM
jgi:hypothetical protein